MEKPPFLAARIQYVAFIILALFWAVGVVHAECPDTAEAAETDWAIWLHRGTVAAFPVPLNDKPLTHRLVMRLCLYDAETKKPIDGLDVDLIRYSGTPAHGGGPRISDLSYNQPARDGLLPSRFEKRERTSATGEIILQGVSRADLERSPGTQYALIAHWDSTESDEIIVKFWFETTVSEEVSLGRLAAL